MSLRSEEARLALRFSPVQSGRSLHVLTQDPPWRVVRSFQVNEHESLTHIHNLSGGILGGDRLVLTADVQDGAQVQLTSTGATRVYKQREGRGASYNGVRLQVGRHALLEYLPDQIIPYAHARFEQVTEVELSPDNAGLFWWETLTAGRTACGERFAYQRVAMRARISCGVQPLTIDQFAIEPGRCRLDGPGVLGRYDCSSTFYICKTGLARAHWLELQAQLETECERLSGAATQWGASCLVAHGILVRGVGHEASTLLEGLVHFWKLAKWHLYGRRAEVLRKVN